MAHGRMFSSMILGLVCCGVTSVGLADGRTYFVRQSGSDLSNGLTPDSALRSIQRAVALATGSGNSVIVGPGVYYEQVYVGSGVGSMAGNGTAEAPNVIIADLTGAQTGDPAAQVVIEGDGVRDCGMRITQRDHWSVSGLTFRGQGQRAIFIDRAAGIDVESCTIYAPTIAGIEATNCSELLISGNTFTRDPESGSCIVVSAEAHAGRPRGEDEHERGEERREDSHGKDDRRHESRDDDHGRDRAKGHFRPSRRIPGETVVIESNRFPMLGELYLASNFGREEHGRRNRVHERVYGIDVAAQGDGATVQIFNNVGSDCYNGIRLRLEGDRASGVIAGNSLAGCWIGIHVSERGGRVLLSDNIVAHSRFAIAAMGHGSKMTISGLLTFDVGGATVLGDGPKSIEGHRQNVDPKWVAPSAGNFALEADSPAIDSGLGAAGLATDIRGLARPYDGNGNRDAKSDLGAYEYHPDEDGTRRLRLVEWREIEARPN